MPAFRSDFLHVMAERGFIHQVSSPTGLDDLFLRESVTAYIGFDATARSLHAGSLIQIMMLHWLQQTGHRPIALMGGGTSMIGDPSFKDEARRLLSREDIGQNLDGIRRNFEPYLRFGDDQAGALMIDNAQWLLDINYVAFLRDVGRHFSVNRMLSFDSVKLRLEREQSLSFLEFNYMILQAYDFVELYRRHGCRLQMGGSDQWGNIVSGIDLGRRMEDVELFALTSPLLTTASGAKMGKTATGAVWLSPDLMKPYEFWQYWRNCEDADVGRFLKLYTTLPLEEIGRLEALSGSELNEAKKILASEVTAMLHGRQAAESAAETARRTFEQGALAQDLPSISVGGPELRSGIGILGLLVRAGLAQSNSDARRQVKGGAVRVNDKPVADDRLTVGEDELGPQGLIKLSMGRKRHVLVRVEDAPS